MKKETSLEKITPAIVYLRGKAVILDSDLALIYGVSTKALNQAVKRNRGRFPADFMFRLSCHELVKNRSQIVTGPAKHRDPRFYLAVPVLQVPGSFLHSYGKTLFQERALLLIKA